MRTNWDLLCGSEVSTKVMASFANGMSKNNIQKVLANTDQAGEFRKLVRNGGTDRARALARKALRRRGVGF